jgi:hypothetical protein
MLLDRTADVHLARRSAVDGWLVKPLDPLRLSRAVTTVLAGGGYREGFEGVQVIPPPSPGEDDTADAEPLPAG